MREKKIPLKIQQKINKVMTAKDRAEAIPIPPKGFILKNIIEIKESSMSWSITEKLTEKKTFRKDK